MDGGRARGAGVLDMDGRRVAEGGQTCRDQRPFEPLAREPVVVDADGDRIDIGGIDAGMIERRPRDLRDQAFDIGSLGFPEHGVGPTHDGG